MYVHTYTDAVVNFTVSSFKREVMFGKDNLTIRLVWSQENHGVSYNVSVVPSVPIYFTQHTTVELSLAYNTLYNVGITATVCGRNSTRSTSFIRLNYSTYTS